MQHNHSQHSSDMLINYDAKTVFMQFYVFVLEAFDEKYRDLFIAIASTRLITLNKILIVHADKCVRMALMRNAARLAKP